MGCRNGSPDLVIETPEIFYHGTLLPGRQRPSPKPSNHAKGNLAKSFYRSGFSSEYLLGRALGFGTSKERGSVDPWRKTLFQRPRGRRYLHWRDHRSQPSVYPEESSKKHASLRC